MTESVKITHSNAKAKQQGCRKTAGEGEEHSPEIKALPLKYGYVSIMGRHRVMADPIMVVSPRKLSGGYSFFAAYGGRGRGKVAEACVDKLHHCLEKHTAEAEEKEIGWGKVVMDSFSCMFEDEAEAAEREGIIVTAVVVRVEKRGVVLVNCGGSRTVLWSRDACNRVSETGVIVTRRIDDSSEDFLIIATDSLWNVVGKEMACEVVRKCLGGEMMREGGGAAGGAGHC